jgi:uncharacterized membrane protein
MLTKEEKDFISYWEINRIPRKKVMNQLSVGLPLAVLLVVAIFVNFFSGWYKKAEMVRNEAVQSYNASLILVLLAACILIVLFITIFSVRHNWDRHEQRYNELIARKDEQ